MKESDNLVSLHAKIRECDTILTHMESLLGGFQADLGSISSEIKNLQEQSMSMGIKLRNRKVGLQTTMIISNFTMGDECQLMGLMLL
jgi:hypothetical protein